VLVADGPQRACSSRVFRVLALFQFEPVLF
jgi:hypothetical protein